MKNMSKNNSDNTEHVFSKEQLQSMKPENLHAVAAALDLNSNDFEKQNQGLTEIRLKIIHLK